ncbi:hypothetical protein OUO_0088 [Helicobacter pylori R046Wa]|nr:hypothetical protein OUO_0088 [Helicobacter pylori R046Wa]
MMWSRFIRILSEMQKGSKYFLNHPSIHPNRECVGDQTL